MNRTTLNASVLGAGVQSKFSLASAAQTLTLLATTARAYVDKCAKASGTLTLSGELHIYRVVSVPLQGALAILSSATAGAYRLTYSAGQGVLSLGGYLLGRREVVGKSTQTCALRAVANCKVAVLHHGASTALMRASAVAVGYDLYTGAAPYERTTGLVEIKTITAPNVGVGV